MKKLVKKMLKVMLGMVMMLVVMSVLTNVMTAKADVTSAYTEFSSELTQFIRKRNERNSDSKERRRWIIKDIEMIHEGLEVRVIGYSTIYGDRYEHVEYAQYDSENDIYTAYDTAFVYDSITDRWYDVDSNEWRELTHERYPEL